MSQYMVMFGNAAAARNGLTAMPVDSQEKYFQIEATNYLVNNTGKKLYIRRVGVITAAIANLTTWRFKLANEGSYSDFTTEFGVDQTGAKKAGFMANLCKEFPSGAKLHCDLNNNNNSQVDVVIFILSDSPTDAINMGADYNPPAGYQPFAFTGSQTLTAAVMTDCALTPATNGFSPNAGGKYHIGGMLILGASAIAGRIKHRGSGSQNIIAGAIAGDIATPDTGIPMFADFGTFTGSEYPLLSQKAVLADTAERVILWIKQTGGPK